LTKPVAAKRFGVSHPLLKFSEAEIWRLFPKKPSVFVSKYLH